MAEKRDNIFVYGLLGLGYLLFCSAIPSAMAVSYASVMGWEVNHIYVPLSFLTGILYVMIVFSFMREKLDLSKNVSWKGLGEAFLTAIILFFVINFVVSPALSFVFPASAHNYDSSVADMMATPVITFFQVAFVAPLFEELIFRGLILKRALCRWTISFSVLMTAALFGILHMSIVQGLSAAAAGILLCLFYVRRRSVGLSILAHGIYNGMVFGLAFLLG